MKSDRKPLEDAGFYRAVDDFEVVTSVATLFDRQIVRIMKTLNGSSVYPLKGLHRAKPSLS